MQNVAKISTIISLSCPFSIIIFLKILTKFQQCFIKNELTQRFCKMRCKNFFVRARAFEETLRNDRDCSAEKEIPKNERGIVG